ncbi:MAG: BamA/TamA family outer membrane protein [Hydrogenophaga sp.]|uniref:autotransporter assembly complex protein TamA n=1 Tax=Hydrogenophaga sp. TaxID=1904254 RepID=UPI0027224C42|nr:BamA/TamA family outer membrane protein [Hydrogenophaga sp.]MDO9483949.1 BamA/TamA family outer membrane protein [Hydrogenophaga sp.]MDP3345946.1 BamA/TamA family outer membrane protein [Hydrogenophaga sp.]MDP3807462.1 BamA/TamA family outer membrane protein [Hydrogenophaga sp.]
MNLFFTSRVVATRLIVLVLTWQLPSAALGQADPSTQSNPVEAAAPLLPDDARIDTAADTAVDETTPPRRRNGQPRPPAEPRFDIDLQATAELSAFLLRHLELQRFRTLRDLDASELERLLEAAPDNLRDLLGTLGYFSPVIEVSLTPATPSTSTSTATAPARSHLGTVKIQVEPGPLTRVASAQVYFKGDIATAPEAAEQREAIRRSGTLATGVAFSQADWDRAKTTALRQLTAQRYPAGRIENSLADIDAATQSANLYIELNSGPSVQVGAVRVEGIERYDPAMVERMVRLAGLTPGSDYDLTQLQAAQQRLAESGYFDSVFVYMDPANNPQASPVVVQVRETKRKMLVLGVGGSTDKGARLSVEHTHHRVPGIGWRALNKLQLERDDQLASTVWSAPVDDRGWRWISSGQAARQIDNFTTTTSQRLRAGQAQDTPDLDRSFFLQYDRARAVNSALRSLLPAPAESSVSANYAWTRRRFNDLVFPESGQGLSVELGVGTTLGDARLPFTRAQARWLGYWPISALSGEPRTAPLGEARPAADDTGRAGRLALRLQGGALWAKQTAPVPETQLFLTGGDTTVRGYGLRDIGVPQADGSVSPGRYLAVASLEWQRPLWRNGTRSPWESVVFVDAGAVANMPGDLRPKWGVGAGMRYNSPVGPLQVDLAYGLQSKRLRVHLNVGFSF